ncbi:helicase [Stylosanthes scabra]|uniref:Helicase n=1 Tax=Stylosanthes scabra TaxID=79078 RepID=A0ABU6TH01_9FABA|nr:helicase [Stylosanthes scabra]
MEAGANWRDSVPSTVVVQIECCCSDCYKYGMEVSPKLKRFVRYRALFLLKESSQQRYSRAKPNFKFLPLEGAYKCKLTLPPNVSFQTIVDPVGKDVCLARNLVYLEDCKKLDQMHALNDHLVPFTEEPPEAEHSMQNKESGT